MLPDKEGKFDTPMQAELSFQAARELGFAAMIGVHSADPM
jgi:hypothetical protein